MVPKSFLPLSLFQELPCPPSQPLPLVINCWLGIYCPLCPFSPSPGSCHVAADDLGKNIFSLSCGLPLSPLYPLLPATVKSPDQSHKICVCTWGGWGLCFSHSSLLLPDGVVRNSDFPPKFFYIKTDWCDISRFLKTFCGLQIVVAFWFLILSPSGPWLVAGVGSV